MTLNPQPAFDAIKTQVGNILGKTKVYVAEIPPDDQIPKDSNGTMLPFAVIYFGGPIRSGSDKSLTNTRNDATILFATIELYAPTSNIAIQLKGKLVGELTGWRNEDISQMTLSGIGMSTSRASNNVRPTQYIESQSWQCFSNLSFESV